MPELQLSAAQEFQVLRIVQEALTNIAKHARARTGLADDRAAGRPTIEVVVEDDGDGLRRRRGGRRRSHYGLEIMRERARAPRRQARRWRARDGGGTRGAGLRFRAAAQSLEAVADERTRPRCASCWSTTMRCAATA